MCFYVMTKFGQPNCMEKAPYRSSKRCADFVSCLSDYMIFKVLYNKILTKFQNMKIGNQVYEKV